jgi:LPXTG-motif cell wall-anchored protein
MLKSNKTDVIAVNDAEGSGTSAAPIVYSCGDALGKCDMNTEPGKFRVVDLADGTYTLTETVAPNGYTAGGSYTVKIDKGMATITDTSGNTIAHNEIPNARNTGAILWNKVSSDSASNKKLGGSEWELTKTKSFSWNATTGKAEYTGIDIAQQRAIKITDCELGTGNTCSAPHEDQKIYDVDPVEGQFKLTGLEWGTYTLVEFKAPDGYDVDSTPRTFTFGPAKDHDDTGQWNSNGVASATGAATGKFTTSNVDYDSSVFSFAVGDIKNQPGVILPATGGEGVNKMYAAGFLAVAIAVAGLALSLRRRQS